MKLPVGIQSFEKIREGGFAYVDKTALVYRLAKDASYYFLSRPRRFGKSLLLSTLKAYFQGRKDLFEGLAIERLETEWLEYPVLYVDLNTGKYDERESLNERLDMILSEWEREYDCADGRIHSLSYRFENVVRRAYEKTGLKVVILIDEYDKPLLQTFGDSEMHERHRSTLKAFYSVLKGQDQYIRFAFLTGVTRFSKVSVFSDLNNLMDISMSDKYSDICGITEKELKQYLNDPVKEMAKANRIPKKACLEKLKTLYDGYHFEHDTVGMYNPFSLLSALSEKKFNYYWFATGTPTILVKALKNSVFDLESLTSRPVTGETLGNIALLWENPLPLIYQSGYLTIKSYNKDSRMYMLDYPNVEVKEGFLNFLIPSYTSCKYDEGVEYLYEIQLDLKAGKPEEAIAKLKSFFDDGNFRIAGDSEKYFHNALCIILRLLGIRVETEVATSRGSIDAVVKTTEYIYLIEFKIDQSAEAATSQITEKGYADKYAMDSRKLYKVGINFSSKTRSIEGFKVEERNHTAPD